MVENNTTTNVSHEFTSKTIALSTVIISICILGVASNILLLLAFIKDPLKCFRNSGTYFVMNLSVSNCLASSISPFYLTVEYGIPTTTASRLIIEHLAFWFGCVSFVLITSISVDRFLMVACPIKHRILMKGKLIILWLGAIWLVSCLFSVSLDYIHVNGRNVGYILGVIIIVPSTVM